MLCSQTPLSSDQIRSALAYFVRAIDQQAVRSDALEAQALIRIFAQYHDWRLPTLVPRESTSTPASSAAPPESTGAAGGAASAESAPGVVRPAHALITFPASDAQSSIVAAYSSEEDISDEMRRRNTNDQCTVGSMQWNGVKLFHNVLHMSQSSVPSPQRVSALSFNNGSTVSSSSSRGSTYLLMPLDGPNRQLIAQAAFSIATTRLLQHTTREQFLADHVARLFSSAAPPSQSNPSERPMWFTVASEKSLITNDFGQSSSPRQNLLLFTGREMALQFLRQCGIEHSAFARAVPADKIAPLLKEIDFNLAIVSAISTTGDDIQLHRFTQEEFIAACNADSSAQANSAS
jgi:hypothetical protein